MSSTRRRRGRPGKRQQGEVRDERSAHKEEQHIQAARHVSDHLLVVHICLIVVHTPRAGIIVEFVVRLRFIRILDAVVPLICDTGLEDARAL